MKELKVRLTFLEEILGTASADPEIHETFIASNAPDAPTRKEEIEAIGIEEAYQEAKETMGIKLEFDSININKEFGFGESED